MRAPLAFTCSMLVALAAASPALAAWPNQPTVNLPVCTASNNQLVPTIASDGSGGAIITWYDFRGGGNGDIYAQHVLASGVVDPAWPANGRALCTATNIQALPTLVSDGSGGAIVAWQDARTGTYDIYAQHVLSSGVVDPAWPVDGRALCTAANIQSNPTVVSDGSGGALVAWQDFRSAASYDIYAQHVLASGAVDPAWPADGRALCTATNQQLVPVIATDGSGGAIVTWQDIRGGANYDIYAQHVLASGAVDPAWPTDGRALCTAANDQQAQQLVPDGAGGAIVAWQDPRSGTADIYAQHVLGSGLVDPTWPTDGRPVCAATNAQVYPTLVSDGSGGAIVTWADLRGGSYGDIYAQHVLATGVVDPGWPTDGRALCAAAQNQQSPTIVTDGAGGAIVTWQDFRSGSYGDIYAQHVLASGAVDPLWPTDGRALSTAANDQTNQQIVTDGAGGAIVAWQDSRPGGASLADIYAQRVARFGYLGTPEAEIVSVKDVPNDQGGQVKLSWNASYLDLQSDANLASYDVLRSLPPSVAAAALHRGAAVRRLSADGFALRPGDLLVQPAGAQTLYWEYLATVPALHYVSGYSYLAATAGDSVAGSNPRTAFMVVARNAGTTMFWPSRPDSGYSVDNIAPVTPAPFTGQYAAGTALLHWNPNTEADLAGYRLYRGTTPGFVPGPASLVAAQADTGYTDPAAAPYYYKLTAIDVHGNESPAATLLPSGALAVDGMPASALWFASPAPNPARGATTLRYALPRAARVRLVIFDAAGRQVRTLEEGARAAGEHAALWDLADDAGHALGAGLYFARLEVEGRTLTRRVMALR